MKQNTKLFFKLLLIVVVIIITSTSCRQFKEPTVTGVESFSLSKINMEGIEAEVKLKLKNPNGVGFSIYPSSFDISYGGMNLGKAKLNKRVGIGANSEKVYSFKLKSKLSDLNPLDALKLLNVANAGKIEVKGDLKAGKFYLKKKFPINYSDKVNILK